MTSTLLSQSESTLGVDYKQFIRQFESYRQEHPEYSFQQAMDAFLKIHAQESTVAQPSK